MHSVVLWTLAQYLRHASASGSVNAKFGGMKYAKVLLWTCQSVEEAIDTYTLVVSWKCRFMSCMYFLISSSRTVSAIVNIIGKIGDMSFYWIQIMLGLFHPSKLYLYLVVLSSIGLTDSVLFVPWTVNGVTSAIGPEIGQSQSFSCIVKDTVVLR